MRCPSSSRTRLCVASAIACVAAISHSQAVISGPGLTDIPLKLMDVNVTFYATFQSHSQKIVQNTNGIFMTTQRHTNTGEWRLWRSVNGGLTWSPVYTSNNPFAAAVPALETDENNNIYILHGDLSSPGSSYFYRFLASENYATAHRTRLGAKAGVGV